MTANFNRDYSQHGDIIDYIRSNHPNPEAFSRYRERWEKKDADLRYILIETTSHCNLSCEMCIHSLEYDKVESMSPELFEALCRNIVDQKIPSVAFNMTNEPLLDPLIFDRISRVTAIPTVVDTFMNTNAVLLNEANSNELLNSGLHRLLVGLDACSEETYKRVRGASYKRVTDNLLRFLEMRNERDQVFPIVRLSFVRNSLNAHEVDLWVNQWIDKVDYLSVQEFIPPVSDGSRDYLFPEEYSRSDQASESLPVCSQPFQQIGIRGNGDITPCCNHQATKMTIGNLWEDDSLANIFNGDKASQLRKSLMGKEYLDNEICKTCIHGSN